MSTTVTVNVSQGTLRGRETSSKNGRTFYSFQGVPYAKPPIGPLRFKVAEPPEPWSGVRDALQEGSSCTQWNMDTFKYEGTEDCLYLNIYTPRLPTNEMEEILRPVMVWIHGGGFVSGCGNANILGPDYLVDEGVVVITINYRLGVLGFLCLNDPSAPGNIGLKDQVEALRWIQKNITKFGGDPNNVTIFGESAGGASVHYQMLSPMSKGLFHKAIAQSGTVLNPWALQHHPRDVAFRLGEALGFKGKQPEDLLNFLQGINDMELVIAATEHATSKEDRERIISFAFIPALEVEADGVERFLPASPMQLIEEGRYHDVPYITGVTSEEGLLLFKFSKLGEEETRVKIETNFENIVLPELRLQINSSKRKEIATKIKHFYFKDAHINEDTLPALVDMYSDLLFAEGVHTTVKMMTRLNKAPLYCYKFSHDGYLNFFKNDMGVKHPGAAHVDDLGYLFRVEMADKDLPPESPDAIVRARMVRMWTNFARTGNPTPQEDSLIKIKWEPCTATKDCYLNISDELSMMKNMFEKRMLFWEDLYQNL